MRPRIDHFLKAWTEDWGLTAFLVSLVVMLFVIAPLSNLTDTGALLLSLFFSITLLTGVAAVGKRRTLTLVAASLVAVALGFRWMAHVAPSPEILSAGMFSAIACLGLLTAVVFVQVFRAGPITLYRVQGAIAAYLLLGLIWGFAYELVLLQSPGSFQPADLGGHKGLVGPDLAYFSFVTLTTLGYGDITPVHPVAKSLAILEALVGQLYPAVLIGWLISKGLETQKEK
jgi:hypothetical protein